MENITKERLMQAGWYFGRVIDISEFENKYKEIGMEMPDIVKDFLRTYGNLEIAFTKEFRNAPFKEEISINPIKAIGLYFDSEYFVTLLNDYGIESVAYPIGLESRGNLIMVMTENGIFYSFTDGCLVMNGKCAEDMLDCVVGETRLPEFIE